MIGGSFRPEVQLDPAHQVTSLLGQVMVIKNRNGAGNRLHPIEIDLWCVCATEKREGLGHIVRGMLSEGACIHTVEWILQAINIVTLLHYVFFISLILHSMFCC